MIKKCFTIWILLVCSVFAYAETEQLRTSKDLVPESIKKFNDIEYISDESKFAAIQYTQLSCEPQELKEENGKKVYKRIEGSEKSIKFIFAMNTGRKSDRVELRVNGVHIVIEPGRTVRFALAENCTKLIPFEFISGSDQEFLGVRLSKGNMFKPLYNNMGHLNWGKIDEDGYLKHNNSEGFNGDGTSQDKTFEENYYKKLLQCAEVKESLSSEKGFYFLNGNKYDFSRARPNFWRANSKYLGHKICSDQPHATVDCEGTPDWRMFADDSIFGISEGYLIYATNDEEEVKLKKEVAKELKQAKELGKKCDDAIAKYEKETGKKVKVSPFYPKKLLRKEKVTQ